MDADIQRLWRGTEGRKGHKGPKGRRNRHVAVRGASAPGVALFVLIGGRLVPNRWRKTVDGGPFAHESRIPGT